MIDAINKNSDNGSNKRPMLTDPKEFAIIKKVYFSPRTFRSMDREDIDPTERADRSNHRERAKINQSR